MIGAQDRVFSYTCHSNGKEDNPRLIKCHIIILYNMVHFSSRNFPLSVILLKFSISFVGSGSLFYRDIDPRPVSYLEHCLSSLIEITMLLCFTFLVVIDLFNLNSIY